MALFIVPFCYFVLSVTFFLSVSSEITLPVSSCPVDSKRSQVDWQNVEPSTGFSLSSGRGQPTQETVVRVCHNRTHLFVRYDCEDDNVSILYHQCNDPVWQADAVEFMIAPGSEVPQYYHELDLGPHPALFAATISNHYGNCTGIHDYYLQCSQLGMAWEAHRDHTLLKKDGWWASMTVPFSFLNNTHPPSSLQGTSENDYLPVQDMSAPTTWRANFYRVDTPKGSGTLEYSSWQPTDMVPPCFHVPSKFGLLIVAM